MPRLVNPGDTRGRKEGGLGATRTRGRPLVYRYSEKFYLFFTRGMSPCFDPGSRDYSRVGLTCRHGEVTEGGTRPHHRRVVFDVSVSPDPCKRRRLVREEVGEKSTMTPG